MDGWKKISDYRFCVRWASSLRKKKNATCVENRILACAFTAFSREYVFGNREIYGTREKISGTS